MADKFLMQITLSDKTTTGFTCGSRPILKRGTKNMTHCPCSEIHMQKSIWIIYTCTAWCLYGVCGFENGAHYGFPSYPV